MIIPNIAPSFNASRVVEEFFRTNRFNPIASRIYTKNQEKIFG